MRTVIALFRFFLFALLCLAVTLTQPLVLLLTGGKGQVPYIIPRLWHRIVCAIFDIKIEVEGDVYTKSQVMYVANHLSYLDIPALGSLLTASFIAKEDVAHWPLFGFLSKLQQTAFISRDRHTVMEGKNALENMRDDGKNMILFAEGTSTPGTEVLPFKSSLFSIALKAKTKDAPAPSLLIQPVTIILQRIDNRVPTTTDARDLYAWHGAMTLAPHLWSFARCRGARLNVIFHPPCQPADYQSRKALAVYCEAQVRNGLDTAHESKAA